MWKILLFPSLCDLTNAINDNLKARKKEIKSTKDVFGFEKNKTVCVPHRGG